jgi:RIO-like serine/threonine protein kinase
VEKFKRRLKTLDNFNSILVKSGPLIRYINPTKYKLIGRGSQGAVFNLKDGRCVKMYAKEDNACREYEAYMMANTSKIIPKLYEKGQNYIVIEYIAGLSLKHLLVNQGKITRKISREILFILTELKRLGFPRVDCNLRHILINSQDEYKIIDFAHCLKTRRPGPKCLFKDLNELGMLDSFLEHVKRLDLNMYKEWKITMSKYFVAK